MKILVLNASPRKARSNSFRLTEAFLRGIRKEKPQAEVKQVELYDLELQECRGCFGCWNVTPGKCVIPDGMNELLENMIAADIVIFSFPLYFFSFPSGMKAFIDRMLPLFEPFMEESASGSHAPRHDFSRKRFVFISTCGFYTAKGNYDGVITHIRKIFSGQECEMIFCGQGELFSVPELHQRTDAYLETVEKAGEEFARGKIEKDTRKKLEELLYPREVFEAMADASWNVRRDGKKASQAESFTRQMAALYNPSSWNRDLVFTFDYTEPDETWQIILKKDGYEVMEGSALPSDLIVHTPFGVWKKIAAGEMEGSEAMMKGLYRIEGNLDYLLHWDFYFGSQNSQPEQEEPAVKGKERKTSMFFLLFPWIVYWTLPSVCSASAFQLIPLLVSMELLLFFRYRFTAYDLLSLVLVNLFCLLGSLAVSVPLMTGISYLAFGLMWLASLALRIPLTAWYSQNEYGGEKIFRNPIFIQTNQILTFLWGIWYVLFGGVCILLSGRNPSVLSLVGYGAIAILGLFTAWFQKYWPERIARGGKKSPV